MNKFYNIFSNFIGRRGAWRMGMAMLAALLVVLLTAGKQQPVTIFIVGDSTAAEKNVSGGRPERGWGMMLGGCFSEDVVVDNHARNGRSSKSFIAEGLWQKVLDRIKPGDYVIIQFGHNDEKPDTARHTEPGSTFDANLARYVEEARARGAHPILMNSVVRRIFTATSTAVTDDDLRPTHAATVVEGDSLIDTHGRYREVPREVAERMGVTFIDANAVTHRLEQSLGAERSKGLHMCYRPGEIAALPEGRSDNTHYNTHGATVVADLLANQLIAAVPVLKPFRRHYDIVVSKEGRGEYMDLQEAVRMAPEGKTTTILLCPGSWPKPTIPAGKKVKIVCRPGAVME